MAILDEDWPAFLEADEKRCMARDRLNRWVVSLDRDQTRGGEANFETVITQVSRVDWFIVFAQIAYSPANPVRLFGPVVGCMTAVQVPIVLLCILHTRCFICWWGKNPVEVLGDGMCT